MTTPSNTTPNLEKYLTEQGYTNLKPMNDGTYAGLLEYLFTTGLMTGLTEQNYHTRYCYEHHEDALKALEQYTPDTKLGQDPSGLWVKAKGVNGDRLNPLWSAAPEPSAFKEDNKESSLEVEEHLFSTSPSASRKMSMKK